MCEGVHVLNYETVPDTAHPRGPCLVSSVFRPV
jgi:hypothetical protein